MSEINKIKENLCINDLLKRRSDKQWYPIKGYIGNQSRDNRDVCVVFEGFVVAENLLHKHFYADIDRKFIVKGDT